MIQLLNLSMRCALETGRYADNARLCIMHSRMISHSQVVYLKFSHPSQVVGRPWEIFDQVRMRAQNWLYVLWSQTHFTKLKSIIKFYEKEWSLLKVRCVVLGSIKAESGDLRSLRHSQEYDKAESEWIDNGSHLVAVSIRHQILQDHGPDRFALEKQKEMRKSCLESSLKLERHNCQTEDDPKQDEQEDLHYHAQIERDQTQR